MTSPKPVAIVTGASRGIGRAIALALAQSGHDIAGVSRSEASAQEPAAAIQETGARYQGYAVDVSKAEEVDAAVAKIENDFGRIDVLVNNAGITRDTLMLRMSTDDWNAVIQTNLTGAFHWTKPVSRLMMRARTGRIINISSVIGQHGNAGQVNYSAAKAGLIGFTKAVAKELAPRGITCNAVCPGFIQTDMTDGLPADLKEKLLANIPLKRLGTPEDIAGAVAFLASPHAGYLTGQEITIDGGLFI
jgi:3-oxoacyl-[acyl-carrier protein] reductase